MILSLRIGKKLIPNLGLVTMSLSKVISELKLRGWYKFKAP
jgi:hypothetical protein